MRIGLLVTALALLLVATVTGPASAARVALVIGNDRYASLPDLQKAVNDARAVAIALEELDFRVFVGGNLKRRETNRLLADFEAAIQPGDWRRELPHPQRHAETAGRRTGPDPRRGPFRALVD